MDKKDCKNQDCILSEEYKPRYHFVIPEEPGIPGDPNGAFFADGVYHLMYLYRNTKLNAFHWGHLTSVDLIHWTRMKDALTGYEGDEGCYSGGGFLDDDKTAYLTFWKFPSPDKKDNSGIGMAYSKPPYEDWHRMEPIAINATQWGIKDIEKNGETEHLACADPSNIWKANGYYYMQTGNLMVLEAYGRDKNAEDKYKGGWTDLFRSKNLKDWEHLHRFIEFDFDGEDWPVETEDDMCPVTLPIFDKPENGDFTGKYLHTFISHNKGCQYFIGEINNEKFYPEIHGRMTWKDSAYFAPEALNDDKNRYILWTWLRDDPKDGFKRFGWSGVYSLPRCCWLENEKLHFSPVREIDKLECETVETIPCDNGRVDVKTGDCFRMRALCKNNSGKVGFKVRVSDDGAEYTEIFVDFEKGRLVMDTTNSGSDGWMVKEEAPIEIEGEVNLDIFVDKCVVEVFANNIQAICRRIYPTSPKTSLGVYTIGKPEKIKVSSMLPLSLKDLTH